MDKIDDLRMGVAFQSVTILGNVEECRTEAEISRDGQIVAIVYEASHGWHTQIVDSHLTPTQSEFDVALETARKKLSQYVKSTRHQHAAEHDESDLCALADR